jgi:hypothetical protein
MHSNFIATSFHQTHYFEFSETLNLDEEGIFILVIHALCFHYMKTKLIL